MGRSGGGPRAMVGVSLGDADYGAPESSVPSRYQLLGTSSCGGRVEAREGKGKAQLRRPAASRPRRDYSGPPSPSAQKLKSRRAGRLRCPIIGASREKHPPPSPREGKPGFSALTRFRAITPNKWKPTGASTCEFARDSPLLPERTAQNRAGPACFGRNTARGRE